jgi:hypothetical protein
VDALPSTATTTDHVGRHERVRLRQDVVDHLTVGEEGNIGDGVEQPCIAAATVAHLHKEHDLGDVMRVIGVLGVVVEGVAVCGSD